MVLRVLLDGFPKTTLLYPIELPHDKVEIIVNYNTYINKLHLIGHKYKTVVHKFRVDPP